MVSSLQKDRTARVYADVDTKGVSDKEKSLFAPDATPHDLRHTWASWHYGLHRDILPLKKEGMVHHGNRRPVCQENARCLPKGNSYMVGAVTAARIRVPIDGY